MLTPTKMALTLRVKAKDGQHVVKQLTGQSTIGELKDHISKLTIILLETYVKYVSNLNDISKKIFYRHNRKVH